MTMSSILYADELANDMMHDPGPEASTYDDFQSNKADPLVSLAGLGIRNLALNYDYEHTDLSGQYAMDTSPTTLPPGLALPHFDPSGTLYDYSPHLGDQKEQEFNATSIWLRHSDGGATEGIARDSPPNGLYETSKSEDSLSQSSSESSTDFALVFEQLSASTGLSFADFAEQLSVSAEATLRQMAEGALGSEAPSRGQDVLHSTLNEDTPKWSTPRLFLPRSFTWNDDVLGVNPADILPPDSPLPTPTEDAQFLPPSAFAYEPGLHDIIMQPTDDAYTPRTTQTSFTIKEEHHVLHHSASDDEHPLSRNQSDSEYSPEFSVGQKRHAAPRVVRRRVPIGNVLESADCQSPDLGLDIDQCNLPPINLGTPVLDAHRGVELEVLKAKAERYRLRNQGREYDKRWLISFAGKLSERGELVDEFRCYVNGCQQSNKRRDHILIHVGAHLDQRPFKCMYCPSRFLRKNECKRHELSHTGLRPFSCHLCPYPSTTFVRQDLLKRHMKRTHRLDLKANKENREVGHRPRKKAKY